MDRMLVWIDPVARPGPEAMAVDEWLAVTSRVPVLRVYRWAGEWGSIGYFGKLADARSSLPDLSWVRRWTGGGTVDHRNDWTYTIFAPAGSSLYTMKGAESYRVIHAALAGILSAEGHQVRLASRLESSGDSLCFLNPVDHDIVDSHGRKLAGAGQRRTKLGLLHQGSVALACGPEIAPKRTMTLAAAVAGTAERWDPQPPAEWIAAKVVQRYACGSWLNRR